MTEIVTDGATDEAKEAALDGMVEPLVVGAVAKGVCTDNTLGDVDRVEGVGATKSAGKFASTLRLSVGSVSTESKDSEGSALSEWKD